MKKSKIELKKEFESGSIVITKDNIALYYEFMSDEYINKLRYTIFEEYAKKYRLFFNRAEKVVNSFNVSDLEKDIFKMRYYDNRYKKEINFSHLVKCESLNIETGLSIFGVKDILKPINEYISDIKASSEYKEYIANK